MSVLRVNQITNKDDDGAVEFSEGLTFASNTTISGAGGINLTGIVTATSFVGDGSNLIGVASTENIITGTAATFTSTVDITTLRATDHEGNFILDSYLFN